jgi:hypothetical protein
MNNIVIIINQDRRLSRDIAALNGGVYSLERAARFLNGAFRYQDDAIIVGYNH